MPSSITANLNSPYLTLWMVINNNSNNAGIVNYTVSGNVATVGAHPFSTGDKVYPADYNFQGIWITRYAIKVSDTQISVATSYVNAIAGTATAFTGVATSSISNLPTVPYAYNAMGINYITEPFLGYSKSAQSFSVNDNVAIDFTVPGWGTNSSGFIPLFWAFGLVSDTGGYKLGLIDTMFFQYGDSITGTTSNTTYRNDQANTKSNLTFNCRILIQNQRAYIQIKTTSNTYITLFTSSVLSTNIQGLRFFSSLALNGRAFTNCTITYL